MRLSKLLLLVLFFCVPWKGISQAKLLKEADGYFYAKKYLDAYHLYEKVYEKKPDKAILLKMAECNYAVENYQMAEAYYEKYFNDTLYHPQPEYLNFANACKLSGKIELATKLFTRIKANGGEANAAAVLEIFKLYLDSGATVRTYCLDSTYTCVDFDASESLDAEAAPMTYVWDFKDGTFAEGIRVTHCFKSAGYYKIALNIRDKATNYVRYNDTALAVSIKEPPVKFKCAKHLKQYFYNTFDASDLTVENHDILEYIWDFGGDTRLGKKVLYKFDKLDYYKIRLTLVAKPRNGGANVLFSSYRETEVVDNYSDHSKTFKDNMREEK